MYLINNLEVAKNCRNLRINALNNTAQFFIWDKKTKYRYCSVLIVKRSGLIAVFHLLVSHLVTKKETYYCNCVHLNLPRWLWSPKQKWRLLFVPDSRGFSIAPKTVVIAYLHSIETPFIIFRMPERVAYNLVVNLCILWP